MQHPWFVKKIVLPLFGQGKDLEVRSRNGYSRKIRVGDVLSINRELLREVAAIRIYPNLSAMILREDYKRIHPGAQSSDELLILLRTLYPPSIEKLGIFVFELKRVGI